MIRYYCIFLFVTTIFFFTNNKSFCNTKLDSKKQYITKEINLNIPQKSTITFTQVPRGIILSVAQQELFYEHSTKITPDGELLLSEIAKLLKTFNNACTIEAHSEECYIKNENNRNCDWENSVIRANIIADYLVYNFGVKSSRLFPIGFGNIMPFKDNVSDKDFDNNRIDFVIFDYSANR